MRKNKFQVTDQFLDRFPSISWIEDGDVKYKRYGLAHLFRMLDVIRDGAIVQYTRLWHESGIALKQSYIDYLRFSEYHKLVAREQGTKAVYITEKGKQLYDMFRGDQNE